MIQTKLETDICYKQTLNFIFIKLECEGFHPLTKCTKVVNWKLSRRRSAGLMFLFRLSFWIDKKLLGALGWQKIILAQFSSCSWARKSPHDDWITLWSHHRDYSWLKKLEDMDENLLVWIVMSRKLTVGSALHLDGCPVMKQGTISKGSQQMSQAGHRYQWETCWHNMKTMPWITMRGMF